ncbi:MAG: plasmid pRiA4b ORF-3 family protein [Ectobacillus sp.]
MLYQIKATLNTERKPVWREVMIDPGMTFAQLHHLLQMIMHWNDYHLHVFRAYSLPKGRKEHPSKLPPHIRGEVFYEIGNPYEGGEEQDHYYDEEAEKVSDWLTAEAPSLMYYYDFGEDWQLKITLERVVEETPFPYCAAAMNEAPPEDSRWMWEAGEIEEKFSNEELAYMINASLKDHWMDLTSPKAQPPQSYIEDNIWSKLLRAAAAFHKMKCWEWIDSGDCFAIEEPMFGETLYCSVLGGIGEVYGLAVYEGAQGLDTLLRIHSGEVDEFGQIALSQHAMLLSFEDRKDLEKEDYELIKRHGFSFRGKKQWPQMQKYDPGYFPATLSVKEAYQLLRALEMTLYIAEKALQDPAILHPQKGWPLIRQDGSFGTVQPEKVQLPEIPLFVPKFVLEQMKKTHRHKARMIIFDVFYLPHPVQDHPLERPYYPSALCCLDGETGLAVHSEVLPPLYFEEQLQQSFIAFIEHLGWIPKEIYVEQERVKRLIMPIARELNIAVRIARQIEPLWELKHGMAAAMMR